MGRQRDLWVNRVNITVGTCISPVTHKKKWLHGHHIRSKYSLKSFISYYKIFFSHWMWTIEAT